MLLRRPKNESLDFGSGFSKKAIGFGAGGKCFVD
jgi:hypothetical protein